MEQSAQVVAGYEAFGFFVNDTKLKLVHEVDKSILAWEMAMFRDAGLRRPPDTHELAGRFIELAAELYREIHNRPLPERLMLP